MENDGELYFQFLGTLQSVITCYFKQVSAKGSGIPKDLGWSLLIIHLNFLDCATGNSSAYLYVIEASILLLGTGIPGP